MHTVETDQNREERARVGLCLTCQFGRVIVSDRGSRFYFCERSKTDPRFPKYPPLPVLACVGYEATPVTRLP
jgi:hypothetical protein